LQLQQLTCYWCGACCSTAPPRTAGVAEARPCVCTMDVLLLLLAALPVHLVVEPADVIVLHLLLFCTCYCTACTSRCTACWLQVPLEDDQIFLHYGEAEFVAAKAKGKSAAQAYYMPSMVSHAAAVQLWYKQQPCSSSGLAAFVLTAYLCSQQFCNATLPACLCLHICWCCWCAFLCRLTRMWLRSVPGSATTAVAGRLVMWGGLSTGLSWSHASHTHSCWTGTPLHK
jgi:hypothetical protein